MKIYVQEIRRLVIGSLLKTGFTGVFIKELMKL